MIKFILQTRIGESLGIFSCTAYAIFLIIEKPTKVKSIACGKTRNLPPFSCIFTIKK